jgi:hypothetical protein
MQNQKVVHESRATLKSLIIVVWLGVVILGLLANPMLSYPGRDGGIFLYIGSLILKGKIPYADVWENKGPLVFYVNAAGLWLAGGSRWGVWMMELLALLGAAWLGFGTARRALGKIPALVGAYIWLHAAGEVLQGGNFSEEFALPFSFIAAAAYLRSLERPPDKGPPLQLGAALAFGFLLRPNLISMQVAAVLAYLIIAIASKNWSLLRRRLGLAALGATGVMVPVLLYFAYHRALGEMIDVALLFNLQYSQGRGLSRILEGVRSASIGLGPWSIALALVGYGASVFVLRRTGALGEVPPQFLLLPLIGWPLEAALSTLSGRNYLHYFIPWAPYLGLLSAVAVWFLLRSFATRAEKYALLVLLALALPSLGNLSVWRDYGAVLARVWSPAQEPFEYRDPVASYVLANIPAEERVFIWGFRPIVNFVSQREAPVSFLPYPLIHVNTPLGQRWAEEFYQQFTAEPPLLIVNLIEEADRERIPDLDPAVRKVQGIKRGQVVLAENLPETLIFIEENYTLVASVDGHGIYRLRSSPR